MADIEVTSTELLVGSGLASDYRSPIGGGCIVEQYKVQTDQSGKSRRHGPYLYLVTKKNGIQDWKYLGKKASARADAALRSLGVID